MSSVFNDNITDVLYVKEVILMTVRSQIDAGQVLHLASGQPKGIDPTVFGIHANA
jgi:hypothetical protein